MWQLFVLAIGFMASQFWAVPSQQAHQDERIAVLQRDLTDLKKQVGDNVYGIRTLSDQHVVIMREQEVQAERMKALQNTLDDHNRRTRRR